MHPVDAGLRILRRRYFALGLKSEVKPATPCGHRSTSVFSDCLALGLLLSRGYPPNNFLYLIAIRQARQLFRRVLPTVWRDVFPWPIRACVDDELAWGGVEDCLSTEYKPITICLPIRFDVHSS